MGKSRSFLSIAVPGGTVFLSSFCIMVLELVAVRGYREDFTKEPGSAKIAGRLGNELATVGNFTEAAGKLKKLLEFVELKKANQKR